MSPSNSVIRRYTTATCTIEISVENSPLSRWTDKTIVNGLSFRLQFDDPRLPEPGKILLQGDRQQLEVLCTIVTNYVQKLLQQSAEDFSLTLSENDHNNTESELKNIPLSVLSTQTSPSFNTQTPRTKVHLESSGNLTHKLYFGDLINQTSVPVIELSLLQLFDLATALDEYSSDTIVIPIATHQNIRTSLPRWFPMVAILVLAASLTPFTMQYALNIQKNRQKVAQNTTQPPKLTAIEPSPQDPTPIPPLPLITGQPQLIPPPSNFNTPAAPLSLPNANIPAGPTTSQSKLKIPFDTSSDPIKRENPSFGTTPNSDNSKVSTARPNQKGLNVTNTKKPSNLIETSPFIATIPNNNSSKIPNLIPTPASVELGQNNIRITAPGQVSPEENQDNLVRRLRTATKTTSDTQVTNNKTLFDTPQVAEAREYLNKRWRSPTGLSQALEYSLILGIDGKIEKIFPLNQVAREYIDSSGIPEIGKPFVSSNKAGQNLIIRVVLSSDNKVQILPETP
ncbi:MAG: DUF4335 domain-containing protein [Aphanizomenon sp.]|jgi:hypothetical protein